MTSRKSRRNRQALAQMTATQEAEKQHRMTLASRDGWASLAGVASYTGKTISLQTALKLATAWACIRLTAQAVSCLPMGYFQKTGEDSRESVEDDVSEVLCESPNEDQTPLEFWEGNVAWLMADGNAYSEKVHLGNRLSALQPIASNACTPHRRQDGELIYRVVDRGKTEELPREKIFHLKGFGFGGDSGLSPIRFGSQSFGSAIAADEVSGSIFRQGLSAGGLIKSENNLTDEQKDDLRALMEEFVGSSNAGKLLLLPKGISYEKLAMSPLDVELLDRQRFSVEDICRWFGMPPIVIGHAAQGQTMWGSGVEQILIAWLTLGIDPLCDRIEARIKKQLIRPTGQKRRYAEFNREALLQMDSAAKGAFLSTMTQNGLMTRNEGRAKLNMPRKDGGDELTVQSNLTLLAQLGKTGDAGQQARAAMRAWLGQFDQEKEAA